MLQRTHACSCTMCELVTSTYRQHTVVHRCVAYTFHDCLLYSSRKRTGSRRYSVVLSIERVQSYRSILQYTCIHVDTCLTRARLAVEPSAYHTKPNHIEVYSISPTRATHLGILGLEVVEEGVRDEAAVPPLPCALLVPLEHPAPPHRQLGHLRRRAGRRTLRASRTGPPKKIHDAAAVAAAGAACVDFQGIVCSAHAGHSLQSTVDMYSGDGRLRKEGKPARR